MLKLKGDIAHHILPILSLSSVVCESSQKDLAHLCTLHLYLLTSDQSVPDLSLHVFAC